MPLLQPSAVVDSGLGPPGRPGMTSECIATTGYGRYIPPRI
jgi:hypothetical protein